jgi:hypothetical protein
MLCVHEAIKGLAELVIIVKPDEIITVGCKRRSLFCYHHHRYTYDAAGIKSISPPNPLVIRHQLNDHQRRIVVQGDSDNDLCTDGSYVETMVVLTST